MKVKELLDLLKKYDGESEVFIHVDEHMANRRDEGGDYFIHEVEEVSGGVTIKN